MKWISRITTIYQYHSFVQQKTGWVVLGAGAITVNKPTTLRVFTELIFWQEETINPMSLLSYLLTLRCYFPGSYASLFHSKQPGVRLYSSLFHLLLTLVSFILLSQKAQILLLNPLFAWQTRNRKVLVCLFTCIGCLWASWNFLMSPHYFQIQNWLTQVYLWMWIPKECRNQDFQSS